MCKYLENCLWTHIPPSLFICIIPVANKLRSSSSEQSERLSPGTSSPVRQQRKGLLTCFGVGFPSAGTSLCKADNGNDVPVGVGVVPMVWPIHPSPHHHTMMVLQRPWNPAFENTAWKPPYIKGHQVSTNVVPTLGIPEGEEMVIIKCYEMHHIK